MNISATSQLTQWWADASTASNAARSAIARCLAALTQFGMTHEAGVAVIATWLLRALRNLARGLERWASDEPRTPQELLALARSLECTQPNLAAELRFIAMHRPDAADASKETP